MRNPEFKDDPSAKTFEPLTRQVVKTEWDSVVGAARLVEHHAEFTALDRDDQVLLFSDLASRGAERAQAPWSRLEAVHAAQTSLWLGEFALRASSSIEELGPWAGDSLRDGIHVLLNTPVVARAARCLVLASLIDVGERTFPANYPGWRW